jgi:hypothetical protein
MEYAAVVIPIYKSELSSQEQASLKQCFEILGAHPLFFVVPESLDIEALDMEGDVTIVKFKNDFFKGITGYNRLLLSPVFYKAFRIFEYILIYQLDAFVFKDELKYWCNKNYDYIGAPTSFPIEYLANESAKMMVGNGGFSLRKTKSFIKALTKFKRLTLKRGDPDFPLPEKSNNCFVYSIKLFLKKAGYNNNNFSLLKSFQQRNSFHEDFFWSIYAPKIWSNFIIPSVEEASKFALEREAEVFYHRNNEQLPFGCHAAYKYEPAFWKQHIKYL